MVGNTGPVGDPIEAVARAAAEGPDALRGLLDALEGAELRQAALAVHRYACRRNGKGAVTDALDRLARRELGWSAEEADLLLCRLLGGEAGIAPHELQLRFTELVPLAVAACEQAEDFSRTHVRSLHRLAEYARGYGGFDQDGIAPLRYRLSALLRREVPVVPGLLPRHVLDGFDRYGPAMRAAHAELLAGAGVAALLAHCAPMDRARATPAWRKRAAALLAGAESGPEVVRRLLEGIAAQEEHRVNDPDLVGMGLSTLASAANTSLVRGLLWAALGLREEWVVPLVGAVALHAGTGIGGHGGMCRSQPIATAAVAVLGECPAEQAEAAVAELGRLPKRVVNRTVAKGIARATEAVSARAGMTASMLRERAVPDLGLDGRGVRETALGAYTAELAVREPGTALLSFRGPEGRLLKTAPKEVREARAEELKEVRAGLRKASALLAEERARLEEHLAAGTVWPAEGWRRYYADPPVTGAVARALVWEAGDGAGEWTAGLPERAAGGWVLAAADGTARPVGAGDRLRLWHPLRAGDEEVAGWRAALLDREERQPFKQVFREVYPLTPAERETAAYSNRFAGHVLRYGQARALMTGRGWAGRHLGYFSDGDSSEMVKELPAPGELPAAEGVRWRARFFVDLVDGGAVSDGVAVLCSTDQVRFERRAAAAGPRGAWERAELAEVPALVLSEALRDVDLFTGVASVGADPDWRDRGEDRGYGDYWTRWGFGELGEGARVRRETLARLLPRTRIADRVELTDRFLRVRGELGAYRIHLGSGNVLMEPSDAYLCVVVDRSREAGRAAGKVFLPFEEDGGMLSVILSKAFLLAADDRITDPTITAQLRRGR
ncbi:DUF4132 domain-containing protein [Streptomyces sp. R302]|uniref:DUF4132 domain-containing protein n=1 Tax=unclassified Streptomyces TaxID=2593676 RepID=UPI00145DEC0F|nr:MULTISPECIES: DUF4132 domain-containing protein [unclassified Streptomyces]NML50505.1 DUF4132 domain-containing protein [Streptomyces sp. R301]NML79496.1 DUF4132 domain-containing protein [Streptomyces sp. R302]